jgi:hypothetical protein
MFNQLKIKDEPPEPPKSAKKAPLLEWITKMIAKLTIKVEEKLTIISTMDKKYL